MQFILSIFFNLYLYIKNAFKQPETCVIRSPALIRVDDHVPRPLENERSAHAPLPSRGRKSVHFSPPPSVADEQLAVLQLRLSKLTPVRVHRGLMCIFLGINIRERRRELGWIRPWDGVIFSG